MAKTTKYRLRFKDEDEKDLTMNYNYMNPEFERSKVKALMSGLIENGGIFNNQPKTPVSAHVVTTETTTVDLS